MDKINLKQIELIAETNVLIDSIQLYSSDLKDELETKPVNQYRALDYMARLDYKYALLRNKFNQLIDEYNNNK